MINQTINTDKASLPPLVVFWFRRDLRLQDNHGLSQALGAARARGFAVLPVFIFDTDILSDLPKNDARVTFIADCLANLQQTLAKQGRAFCLFHGRPTEVFAALLEKHDIRAVFCNEDYEPSAIARDRAVKQQLNARGVAFRAFQDQVIFAKNAVVKADASPYTVFTPYKKRWLQQFDSINDTASFAVDLSVLLSAAALSPASSLSLPSSTSAPQLPTSLPMSLSAQAILAALGFSRSSITAAPYGFEHLNNYHLNRDFPALAGTSRLSLHLRFGTVSVRQAFKQALAVNDTLVSELIWREFFMQILWHFPQVVTRSFRPAYEHLAWRNSEQDFAAWCAGKTGYPLVDAGMRELNTSGYMHNRVRMVVASFLCKHLLLDWRWGERYFAEKLLDYDLSANNGNWQWAAGCGCDAAPYFRIFNPMTQAKKFDAQGEYIRRHVPEFDSLAYPPPIVAHQYARQRCLQAYRQIR